MDIQPQSTKPISDDQELAKVLAGITQETNNNLSFEETPAPAMSAAPTPPSMPDPIKMPAPEPVKEPEAPADYNPPTEMTTPAITAPVSGNSELEVIRKDALTELRPLVDKLDLEPDEKFDIYLLLLRSTDDKTLIAPAHEAARNIADESKRAQALLDIIKEIDYLSTNQQ